MRILEQLRKRRAERGEESGARGEERRAARRAGLRRCRRRSSGRDERTQRPGVRWARVSRPRPSATEGLQPLRATNEPNAPATPPPDATNEPNAPASVGRGSPEPASSTTEGLPPQNATNEPNEATNQPSRPLQSCLSALIVLLLALGFAAAFASSVETVKSRPAPRNQGGGATAQVPGSQIVRALAPDFRCRTPLPCSDSGAIPSRARF